MKRGNIIFVLLILLFKISYSQEFSITFGNAKTFSIAAWDSITNELGVAVCSELFAIGAGATHAEANCGVVIYHGELNTGKVSRAFELLKSGFSAQQVLKQLFITESEVNCRQIGIVDIKGGVAAYSGLNCLNWAGYQIGSNSIAIGLGLTSGDILKSALRIFEITSGSLANRFITVLENVNESVDGLRAAALLIVHDYDSIEGIDNWLVDLRVDDNSKPITELRRLYNVWESKFSIDRQLKLISELERKKKYVELNQEKNRLVNLLNTELRSNLANPDVLNRIAYILTTFDIDYNQALELSKRSVKLSPTNLTFYVTLAECHFRLGNFEEAISIVSELVSKEPTNDQYWRLLLRYKEGMEKMKK